MSGDEHASWFDLVHPYRNLPSCFTENHRSICPPDGRLSGIGASDPLAMSEEPELLDPSAIVQDAIAKLAEGGAFCAGFVLGIEWLEEDGSRSIEVHHSPMPPWHLTGLLDYMKDEARAPLVIYGLDLDDDDEFGEDF